MFAGRRLSGFDDSANELMYTVCQCASIRHGISVRPPPSITVAHFFEISIGETSLMRLPSISTFALIVRLSGSQPQQARQPGELVPPLDGMGQSSLCAVGQAMRSGWALNGLDVARCGGVQEPRTTRSAHSIAIWRGRPSLRDVSPLATESAIP